MSPELERLLEAYDQKLNCPAPELPQRVATFERLFADDCGYHRRDQELADAKQAILGS